MIIMVHDVIEYPTSHCNIVEASYLTSNYCNVRCNVLRWQTVVDVSCCFLSHRATHDQSCRKLVLLLAVEPITNIKKRERQPYWILSRSFSSQKKWKSRTFWRNGWGFATKSMPSQLPKTPVSVKNISRRDSLSMVRGNDSYGGRKIPFPPSSLWKKTSHRCFYRQRQQL